MNIVDKYLNEAKDGSIKIDGEKFILNFVDDEYIVLDSTDNEMTRIKTKDLNDAKRKLKKFLKS